MQRMVSLPRELADNVLDSLCELRGERAWWKDEPRCNYQRDYQRMCDDITTMETLLGRTLYAQQSRTAAPLLDCGKTSDGYHTFDELYEHRNSLFLSLMATAPARSWISTLHSDGTSFGERFVAGMRLPTGDVTYHLPSRMWGLALKTGAVVYERAPKWDGHTSADVVKRIQAWVAA